MITYLPVNSLKIVLHQKKFQLYKPPNSKIKHNPLIYDFINDLNQIRSDILLQIPFYSIFFLVGFVIFLFLVANEQELEYLLIPLLFVFSFLIILIIVYVNNNKF